jgi:hypothetical protein
MLAVTSTSEMPVNFYETTHRNIPEDGHLYTCRCEHLKSHLVKNLTIVYDVVLGLDAV